MDKRFNKTHPQQPIDDVREDYGSKAPDPVVSGLLRGSKDLYQIKRIVSLLDPLLWELKRYEMSVVLYWHKEKGSWQGKLESDDIWPIEKKSYIRPWSDFQIEVWENLKEKRDNFIQRVETVANFVL